jgi:hypothetical protein
MKEMSNSRFDQVHPNDSPSAIALRKIRAATGSGFIARLRCAGTESQRRER